MQTETLTVTGMTSEAATSAVIQALTAVAGVRNVTVDYASANAVVEFDEQKTAKQELLNALAKSGFSKELQKKAEQAQGGCCGGCCS